MALLATLADVVDRIGDDLEPDQEKKVMGLLEEASILVEGYLGRVPDPVPRGVSVVVSRMVARVLQAPAPSFSVDSISNSAGAFSQSQTFTTGSSGGSPWLTNQDKTVLNRFRKRRGFYSIPMV